MFEDCRSLALDQTSLFYLPSCMLLVWHKLICEKAITKKRIAILMKETKTKTSLLSLTLEPGNKSLVRSIIFLLSEKQELKTKDGRDNLITTSTFMTIANTWSFQSVE